MEKFEITYKGQKIEGVKEINGKFHVVLPPRTGKNGEEFYETISRQADGWLFSSIIKGDSTYFTNVWLLNDGRMAYESDENKRIVFSKESFDPFHKYDDFTGRVCKDIYSVAKQYYEHEKMGIPSSIIGKLRRKRLDITLKLLGYSGTDKVKNNLNDSAGYMDLRRLGDQLETYRNLGAYVYSIGKIDGIENFGFDIPDDMAKEDFQEMAGSVFTELSDDFKFIEVQDEQNSIRREVLNDFCLDMRKKIPEDEWSIYSRVVRKTAELFLELNSDLVPYGDKMGLVNASSLVGNSLYDRISRLIDAREFSQACNIEDRFVIQEAERFSEKIDEMVGDDDRVKQSSIGVILERMKREAVLTREQKQEYTERYNKIQEMYFSKTAMYRDEIDEEKEGISQDD